MRRGMQVFFAVLVGLAVLPAVAQAMQFSPWTTAAKIDEIGGNSTELNTPYQDGCPIQSPDGLSLYMASTRPGGQGSLDIWVARRESTKAPWGAPVNLGEPVNSAADEFCPTPVGRNGLYFVSREALPGSCGMGDIYFTRSRADGSWREPKHLACAPIGPNSEIDEQGPSFVNTDQAQYLFFSRSSATALGEIFVSTRSPGGAFGAATAVAELNDAAANDLQPNVRKDGLEVVFSSNRTGTLGGQDIWMATRDRIGDPWSVPVDLGSAVNTSAAETRPSLSWNARQLLFGRTPGPEGIGDIYVSIRTPVR